MTQNFKHSPLEYIKRFKNLIFMWNQRISIQNLKGRERGDGEVAGNADGEEWFGCGGGGGSVVAYIIIIFFFFFYIYIYIFSLFFLCFLFILIFAKFDPHVIHISINMSHISIPSKKSNGVRWGVRRKV